MTGPLQIVLIGSLCLLVKMLLTRLIPSLMNAISTFWHLFPMTDQFNFMHLDCDDVAQIVRSMPANTSSGINNIPLCVIKHSLPATLPVITSLINVSFIHGIFPRSWKLAVMLPILKYGNYKEPNNNRPIALLPILSKVCERVRVRV